ncbi:MAG: hypothetical protein HRT45_06265 [Bdellovibrionales bacterium]|nr:hypothetical protein [Bdellovibrionales bacterium]
MNVNQALAPLFNDDLTKALIANSVGSANPANLSKLSARISDAAENFGSFQPAKDGNLLFRPGFIDFKQFALAIGKAGDFYSGHTVNPEILLAQQNFLTRCAQASKDQILWPNPEQESCAKEFAGVVLAHVEQTGLLLNRDSEVFSDIGESIQAFPVTALLVEEGYTQYLETQAAYNSFQVEDVSLFSVPQQTIKYGYWLPPQTEVVDQLELSAANQLTHPAVKHPGDLKSEKFYALGSGKWFDALSTSPAEPGLTNIQPIPSGNSGEELLREARKPIGARWTDMKYREGMVSTGGWPDLHPTQVLASYQPCQSADIVCLTREGAASTFGQQIFVMLSGLQEQLPDWDQVSGAHDYQRFVEGTSAEGTVWDQIYNVTTPESSFNRSLHNADFVLCTDWDNGSLWAPNGIAKLSIDAYSTAPLKAPEAFNTVENPGCAPFVGAE